MLDFNLGDIYPTESSGDPAGTSRAAATGRAAGAKGLTYWLRILTGRPLNTGHLGSSGA